MFSCQLRKQAATVLAAAGLLSIAFASQAHAGDGVRPMKGAKSSAACQSAMRSAWLVRQLQITEGDTNPPVVLTLPAECAGVQAASDTAKTQEKDAQPARSAANDPK
jgi:hypothetical protein